MADFATLLLVDRRGWLLLQERDEHAPFDAERWGLVGGHVEEDEEFATAAHRELKEETGLSLDVPLVRWAEFAVPDRLSGNSGDGTMVVFVAAVDIGNEDVVVGEGRQIVFCDPERIEGLDLAEMAAEVVGAFLRSPTYASMVA